MYAIIKTGGKQYKVTEGETLSVEKLSFELNTEFTINEVLMISEGEEIKVGTPFVEGAKVTAEIVEQGRCKKVISFKYKRRKGFHKKKGHRQSFSKIKITKIEK